MNAANAENAENAENTSMTPSPQLGRARRSPVPAFGGLALAILVAVAAVRWSGMPIHAPDAPAVVMRELRFVDTPEGHIDVIDAKTKKVVDTITGQAGFIRGTLRGLARERRRDGIGAEQPFQLIGRADGRLTLVDPATNRHVDLESFGPMNSSNFARLLTATAP